MTKDYGKITGTQAMSFEFTHHWCTKEQDRTALHQSFLTPPQGSLSGAAGIGFMLAGSQIHLASPSPCLDLQMGKSSVVEGKNTYWISHTPDILLQLPLHCGILGWEWSMGPSFLTSALEPKSERVTPELTALKLSCGDPSFGDTDALCLIFSLWHFCQPLVIPWTPLFALFSSSLHFVTHNSFFSPEQTSSSYWLGELLCSTQRLKVPFFIDLPWDSFTYKLILLLVFCVYQRQGSKQNPGKLG